MNANLSRFLVMGLAAMSMLTGTAGAASIGVQFVLNAQLGNVSRDLSVNNDTAGVVVQNNWNAISGQFTTVSALKDNAGVATTASIARSGGTEYSAGSTMTGGDIKLSSNTILALGAGVVSTTFSSIPYTSYDVYVYGTNDSAAAANRHTSITDGSTFASFLATNNASSWIQGTGTWDGTGSPPTEAVGTYVKFIGKTSASLTISWRTAGNSGVNGIQIVDTSAAVPEPSAIGLLLVAGMLSSRVVGRRNSQLT